MPAIRTSGIAALLLALMTAAPPAARTQDASQRADSAVRVGHEIYGALPDELGPIGGGEGYRPVVTGGDFIVRTVEELTAALAAAREGQTVFLPGDVQLDLTEPIANAVVLKVPGGVTLASDRGWRGSPGALLVSRTLKTAPMIQVDGPDARVTGLRLSGPEPGRQLEHHRRAFAEGGGGYDYYYSRPISDGILTSADRLEVDNCEIMGFSHSGIFLVAGQNHIVHHNTIHHCQYEGLGYGVCLDAATALIERNRFDQNRHSIAGTGRPGSGYEAQHNVVSGAIAHAFDMHGFTEPAGNNLRPAGSWLWIHHNLFLGPQVAVGVDGVPVEGGAIHHNWFAQHRTPEAAVRTNGGLRIASNLAGYDPFGHAAR